MASVSRSPVRHSAAATRSSPACGEDHQHLVFRRVHPARRLGVYCSAKFAVEGLSESLGHELAPLGIPVTAIEPGGFRTNFLDDSSLVTAQATIEDYAGTAGATCQWAEKTNHAQAGDRVKAAKVIVDLADRTSLPERIQLGEDCFTAVASKLARTARDQARWREISISTGYQA